MAPAIHFFTSLSDNRELTDYAKSLGLMFFPPLIERQEMPEDPANGPFGWLSFLPREQLHPYGNPPRVGPATDPLIFFIRSYYKEPYFVQGEIHAPGDVPELYKLTKPYYDKLAKWIKTHWEKRKDGRYMGPGAIELEKQGAQLVSLPPGVKVEKKIIP